MSILESLTKQSPKLSPFDYTTLVYGKPGVGKTTFVQKVAEELGTEVLFLGFEDGHKHLDCYVHLVQGLPDFLAVYSEILKDSRTDSPRFKIICIDTIDKLYRMIRADVLKTLKIKHESELEWGKGYSFVKSKWEDLVTSLCQAPVSVWMVSHLDSEEVMTTKEKFVRHKPSLHDKPLSFLEGSIDLVMYMDQDPNSDRVLKVETSPYYVSKARLPNNAKIPNTVLTYADGARTFVGTFQGCWFNKYKPQPTIQTD